MDNGAREIFVAERFSFAVFYGEHKSTSQTTQLRLENCSIFQHFQDINFPFFFLQKIKIKTITEVRIKREKRILSFST